MRKYIIVLLLTTFIGGYFGINYYQTQKMIPYYLKEKKNISFSTEEERKQYIQTQESKVDNIGEEVVEESAGGYNGVEIGNVNKLTEIIADINLYINLEDKLLSTIAFLPSIAKETKEIVKKGKEESHYKTTQAFWIENYGIATSEDYVTFINTLDFAEQEITGAALSNINEKGNLISCELRIVSALGSHVYNLHLIHSLKNKEYIISWE